VAGGLGKDVNGIEVLDVPAEAVGLVGGGGRGGQPDEGLVPYLDEQTISVLSSLVS
jgi:hypothetical protein